MKRLLFLFLLITSCGNLYKVSTEENSGIPFFKQEVVETETLTYRESFFRIELTQEYEKTEKKETANVKKSKRTKSSKSETKKNSSTLGQTTDEANNKKKFKTTIVRFGTLDCGFEINSKFNNKTSIEEALKVVRDPLVSVPSKANVGSECTYNDNIFNYLTIDEVVEKINGSSGTEIDKKLELALISHVKSRSIRPSPKPHYVNINKSITGSTSATITLNENGTLASAASTVQDDLVGKLIDKIPLTDIILSELNISDGAQEESFGDEDEHKLVSISLKLIPVHRDYIVSNCKLPLKPNCLKVE
jgi:hypothetical protein